MTRTILIIAAAIALPASAAFAQAAADAGHGALAGRSPHKVYRTAAAPTCGKVMHAQPAGKLPVYGTHASGTTPCNADAIRMARADNQQRTARD